MENKLPISNKAKLSFLSPIRKYYKYADIARKKGIKVISLNIGQPDIPTPKEFYDAVRSFNETTLFYAPSQGIPCLTESMIEYYKKLGIELTKDEILVTYGGSEAIQFALFSILNDGDEVIIPEPFYPNYATFVNESGGKIIPLKTSIENNFKDIDIKKIEKLITNKTKAIMFSNPSNPTGVIYSKEELKIFIDIAVKHNLYLICDEVYREYYFNDTPPVSVMSFKKASENVILTDSVSKRFSSCGARIGAIISKNKNIMLSALKFAQARLSVSTIEQIGASALHKKDEKYFSNIRDEYKKRRDIAIRELKKIDNVTFSIPEGAFYIMAKLPINDCEDFQKWLLEEFSDNNETVMFSPAESFYATKGKGKNEIRIAYPVEEDKIIRGIELLKLGLKKYMEKNNG